MIGRNYANAGAVDWEIQDKQQRDDFVEMSGVLRNKTYGEEVSVQWLYPKRWNGRVVVWLDDNGTAGLKSDAVKTLVKSGVTVVGANLFLQDDPAKQTRTVANPRQFAGYTHGYNHSLFAQRTHDVLTLVTFLHNARVGGHPAPKSVGVVGWGSAGPVVAAARALAGPAIHRAAVDTSGFRFSKVLDYRDPMFLPGGAKFLDLPGLLTLSAPHPLWLAGEGRNPEVFGAKFTDLTSYEGESARKEASAAEWLLRQ